MNFYLSVFSKEKLGVHSALARFHISGSMTLKYESDLQHFFCRDRLIRHRLDFEVFVFNEILTSRLSAF